MIRSAALSVALGFAAATAAGAETLPTLNDLPETYAGTFLCGAGEMGMTMQLRDIGPLPRDCDPNCEDPAIKHAAKGVIRFFPTIVNPDAPAGAFTIEGTVNYTRSARRTVALLEMEPVDWIEQPDGFGASGLEYQLLFSDGVVTGGYGRPTADGCFAMKVFPVPGL